MKWIHMLAAVFAIAAGLLVVMYGGGDDSPGAQGIGILSMLGGLFTIYRAVRGETH